MSSRNDLIRIIRAFWRNRRDNACFISHLEDNGLITLDPENEDVELNDGTLHCTCGAGNAIAKHIAAQHREIEKYVDAMAAVANGGQGKKIVTLEEMQDDYNAAINYALDEDHNEGILFLQLWREGDWESIDNEFPEFKISNTLRNAQP